MFDLRVEEQDAKVELSTSVKPKYECLGCIHCGLYSKLVSWIVILDSESVGLLFWTHNLLGLCYFGLPMDHIYMFRF
jgi:hypothetical protein